MPFLMGSGEPDHERILGDIGRLLRVAFDYPSADDDSLATSLAAAAVDDELREGWSRSSQSHSVDRPSSFFGVTATDDYVLYVGTQDRGEPRNLCDDPEYRIAIDYLPDFVDPPV